MNYYQDSQNDYQSMNRNCFCKKTYEDNCSNKHNDYYDENFFNKSCCLKRIEETICCYPSYYNENNHEYNHEQCLEGTFKIYPNFNNNTFSNNKQDNKSCHQKNNNKCCFFRRFFR